MLGVEPAEVVGPVVLDSWEVDGQELYVVVLTQVEDLVGCMVRCWALAAKVFDVCDQGDVVAVEENQLPLQAGEEGFQGLVD